MGPLLALLPMLLGGLFGGKPEPAPAAPPPPDHTPELLKAMEEQHKADLAVINRLIDKLDARDKGTASTIGLDDKPAAGGPILPTTGAAEAKPGTDASPKTPDIAAPKGDPADKGGFFGILKDLIGIVQKLTDMVAKLLGQTAAPAPIPAPEPVKPKVEPPPPGPVPIGTPVGLERAA